MKKSPSIAKTYCQLLKVWYGQKCAWQQGLLYRTLTSVQSRRIQPLSTQARTLCTEVTENPNKSNLTGITWGKKEPTNLANAFRTDENDVVKHEARHATLYYKVKREDYEKFFHLGQLSGFRNQVATFRECGVMIRKPALEVFQIADSADLELPPLKILLYGQYGAGKSMTLSHVVHRLSSQGFVTVHFPNIRSKMMFRENKPRKLLTQEDDLLVHTDDAVHWLQLFKDQNSDRLANIKTREELQFTIREKYPEGTPIIDVIQFGIDRDPFSTRVIGIVLDELRRSACEKRIKILVAYDGLNVFWRTIAHEKKMLPADQFVMFRHFKEMLEPTWTNGIIVGTLCPEVAARDIDGLIPRKMDFSPYNILGKEAFKFLDPFVPIEVPRYSEIEAKNCLDYYIDNHWISLPEGRTPEGKQDLLILSAKVPKELMDICSYW